MTNRPNSLRNSGALWALAVLAFGALLSSSARAEDASVPANPPVFPSADAPQQSSTPDEIAATLGSLPAAPDPAMVVKVTAPKAVYEQHVADALKRKAAAVTPASPTPPASENIWAAAQRLKLALPLSEGRMVVKKAERRLELWNGPALVKTYRVALGKTPTGHKAQQGDGRTPEGEFFICTRNSDSSAFHIFLGLSYPALPDAQRGLQTKAISQREFLAIRNRLASRNVPLWRTRLGGWVGIHGGTGGAFAQKQSAERKSPDWTAGCIALTNAEIEEIYAATKMGTPVSVRP